MGITLLICKYETVPLLSFFILGTVTNGLKNTKNAIVVKIACGYIGPNVRAILNIQ